MSLIDQYLISIIRRLRRVLREHDYPREWVSTKLTMRELKVLLDAAERSLEAP